jgi:hypothetical protein
VFLWGSRGTGWWVSAQPVHDDIHTAASPLFLLSISEIHRCPVSIFLNCHFTSARSPVRSRPARMLSPDLVLPPPPLPPRTLTRAAAFAPRPVCVCVCFVLFLVMLLVCDEREREGGKERACVCAASRGQLFCFGFGDVDVMERESACGEQEAAGAKEAAAGRISYHTQQSRDCRSSYLPTSSV